MIGCKSEKDKGIDRKKRSVFKNGHERGGLNITDVECLNKSLKLRQFIRASSADHPIRKIQKPLPTGMLESFSIVLFFQNNDVIKRKQ